MEEEVVMSDGTVNSQITDSVTQTIASVLGNSSAETKSMLDALMAETVGMAMYNAVTNQHNAQMVSNASMTAACARMLRTPYAGAPSVAVSAPAVTSITPTPVPLSPTVAQIVVTGTGFQPNMIVEILENGTKFAVLSGSAQLSNPSGTGFSFSNSIFTAEATYGLQVRNPDGGTSAIVQIVVQAQAPTITGLAATATSITVTGTNFQPNLTVGGLNSTGLSLSLPPATGVTPTTFTMLFTAPATPPTPPYGITVTNPDGRCSNQFMPPLTT